MAYTGLEQSERTGNGSTNYQYDATGIGSLTTSSGTSYFTNSPDGTPIRERIGGATYYYLYDGLGSVVALTDSTGNLVNSYSYDPYGNTTSATETVPNPFRYTGAIWDSSTDLYKLGERYYDPTTGRFSQGDPLGGGYAYADDNPINFVDPSGLASNPDVPPMRGGALAESSSAGGEEYNFGTNELDTHYAKHADEWGTERISKSQYLERARSLLRQRPGGRIRGYTRPNGDVVRYNTKTNANLARASFTHSCSISGEPGSLAPPPLSRSEACLLPSAVASSPRMTGSSSSSSLPVQSRSSMS